MQQGINKQDIQKQKIHTENEKLKSGFTNMLSQRKFALLFILMIIVVIGLFFAKTYRFQPKTPTVIKKTVMKQMLVTRSKDKGVLIRGLTGKAFDVNTGKVVKAARIFSLDDKSIYLELDFNNAPKGLVIDYLRYKDGKYVDHGEITIAKDNTQNTLFNWTVNNLMANLRNGKWRIVTYTNGILAKRFIYLVKSNKVSYVYPDLPIKPTDPDYKLADIIVQK